LGNLSDGVGAAYWLYESPSNNTYEFIRLGSVPTKNIKDCFSVPDADRDGKLEFVVKGYRILSALIDVFIFEATGDNTYEIIDTLILPGGDYEGGYSDAGDVDGDSIPEIVLEARQNVFIIKASGNDSFYVWDTLPGNVSGSSVRVTNDIDGNGLNEIVISGNDETRIYEYDAGGVEETAGRLTPDALSLEVYPNPFFNRLTIKFQIPNFSLKIYDATGRLVRQWDYQTMRQCDEIVWDGTDDSGHKLPAGVYFCCLETNEFTVTKKIVKLQ